MRWRRIAIGMVVAVAGIGPAAAQGVSVEARTELVTVEPYVERLVLTLRNSGPTPAAVRIAGSRGPWPNELPPFSTRFECVTLVPIENNLCVVNNPCLREDFLPIPPICGAFTVAPGTELQCAWRVTQRNIGCAGELLRFTGSTQSMTLPAVVIPLLTQLRGVPTLAPALLVILAGTLALAGWVMLMRRRRRHVLSP